MNNPFDRLPTVPKLTVTSADISHQGKLPLTQVQPCYSGDDISPQLSWSGAPEGTKSFVVQCYDPDAPTMSGYWHWVVANLPPTTTSLLADSGALNSPLMVKGALTFNNDAGERRFAGAAPPVCHGAHRYFFVVQALDVAELNVDENATAATVGFHVFQHVIARGHIEATFEAP